MQMADAVLMPDAEMFVGESSGCRGTLENEISQSRRLKIEHGIFLNFNQGHSSYFHVAMGAMGQKPETLVSIKTGKWRC